MKALYINMLMFRCYMLEGNIISSFMKNKKTFIDMILLIMCVFSLFNYSSESLSNICYRTKNNIVFQKRV